MSEQIKKWFASFAELGLISSREAFRDYICDSCNEEIIKPEHDHLWTGQNFGMGDYTICPQCKENGRYMNTNLCDFRFWKMFQIPNEEIEKIKDNFVYVPEHQIDNPVEETNPVEEKNPVEETNPSELTAQKIISLPSIQYTADQALTRHIFEAKDNYIKKETQRCTKFDLGAGWYRRRSHDEDLCQYHGGLIMTSTDQKKWHDRFRLITSQDLCRIELSDEKQYRHYEDGRGGVFLCHQCDLVLPQIISDEQYLKVCMEWFEIDCQTDHLRNEKLYPLAWECCVGYNGNQRPALYDKFLVLDPLIGNIAQWVPFDMAENPVGLEGSDGGYALVNCNPQSPHYLQVGTIIFDNHGRTSFDRTDLTLCEYLDQKAQYLANQTKPDEAVHEIYLCDTCDVEPIIGRRYQCCHREDLCAKCYTEGKRCNYTATHDDHVVEEQAFHPLDFIEHLRQKLDQGFYYG
jgi:hypothetical protein